jgi:L-aminopeptidase/D-esterase-like protein
MSNETITAIPGLLVGHDTNEAARTGCTVVLTPEGATASVDVRGAAPGTRETDLLRPENLVEKVHGIVLAGGSAFGLAAADGVMRWLHEHGYGFDAGVARVPIVPAAVLFDLAVGRNDVWPDADAGYRACQAASDAPVALGQVGAGTGATVAKLLGPAGAQPGGLGSAVIPLPTGGSVGALVAVNAVGEIYDPATGEKVAAAGGGPMPEGWPIPGANTTLAVVATDVQLSKTQCQRVAQMAHDGFARAIKPSHTMYDGDTIFALSTGAAGPGDPNLVGIFAAEAIVQAILAVFSQSD